MTDQEYVETLHINGKEIKVGLDDYGQCYFFEYLDENNKLVSVSCGSYNSQYLEEIYYYFDPYSTEISLYGKDYFDEITQDMLKRYNKYKKEENDEAGKKYIDDWYMEVIKPRLDLSEWTFYDFDKMYKNRE